MEYEFQLDDLLNEVAEKHFPTPEPELEVQEVIEDMETLEKFIEEPVSKLDLALQKRREIREQTNRTYERPTLNLGKQVINYEEVVEGLGLTKPRPKPKPTPVVFESVEAVSYTHLTLPTKRIV